MSGILLNIIGTGFASLADRSGNKKPGTRTKQNFVDARLNVFWHTFFRAFDMQVDSSITLFTDRIVDRTDFWLDIFQRQCFNRSIL